MLANSPEMLTASRGYGPVAGVLLIAAATVTADPWSGSAVPLATILAACDGDVTTQDGQFFYEGARLAPQQSQWATSVWLERANHNYFNQTLGRDPFGLPGRPDCDLILEGETQRRWLTDYAVDFLTTLFAQDPTAVRQAEARVGMDVHAHAPDALYAPAGSRGWAGAGERSADDLPAIHGRGIDKQPAGRQRDRRRRCHPFLPQGVLQCPRCCRAASRAAAIM